MTRRHILRVTSPTVLSHAIELLQIRAGLSAVILEVAGEISVAVVAVAVESNARL